MKLIWVFVLLVLAIVLAIVGVLASVDPEGRGALVAEYMFGAALLALILAAAAAIAI